MTLVTPPIGIVAL